MTTKTVTFTPEAAAFVAQVVAEAEARMARYSAMYGGFRDQDMAAQFAVMQSASASMSFAADAGVAWQRAKGAMSYEGGAA